MKEKREELTQIILDHPEICDQLLTRLQSLRSVRPSDKEEGPHLSALEIYPTLNDENKRRFEARMMEIAAAEGVL